MFEAIVHCVFGPLEGGISFKTVDDVASVFKSVVLSPSFRFHLPPQMR